MTKHLLVPIAVVATIYPRLTGPLLAQDRPPNTIDVGVNGRSMHVWTGSLERRKPDEPVVILEAGVPGTSQMWRSVFPDIGRLAPVFAYDRSGLGKSEFDGEAPIVLHVANNLHALLDAAHIPPPYVLVGASWGGVLIRAFAHQYPKEVVGLVYLDVTDYERTCEELRTVLPAANCPPPSLPLPADIPSGLRAELTQVSRYASTEFAEIRALRVGSDMPVAVVVGGRPSGPLPPNALTTNVNIMRLIQIRHQADWALSSRAGLLLVSSEVGHNVVQDDPALVLQAVKHVLDHVTRAK
jgi:pimeloyl-ACP methyl ester carboxylesterase